ncbi:hypothetical protein ACGFMM_16920 [Streptomyces sp. NPDC048604]|uniref:hypothetical protein n=1 Tax=Streptomyces sp. NPDC048604 TaxID=3365578 RepID=UPI003721271C
MSTHRRLGLAAAAALLPLAVAGCSDLGRSAVGTITYETQRDVLVTVTSPSVNGCHRLAPAGVKRIENNTLVDIILYPTRDCSGRVSTYVATNSADTIAPDRLPWRSFTVVH